MKDSNINTFNKTLKEYYSSMSLSEDQLDDLLMMQIEAHETGSFIKRQSNRQNQIPQTSDSYLRNETTRDNKLEWVHRFLPVLRNYRNAFYVTAFLFLGCLFTVFSLLDQEPLSQRIMSEIVYNHNQDMPIEIESSSLADISDYLNKLSFSIVLPSALSEPNWQLLGGRYCSINGKLAAQLKVKNLKDNSISTFYQAAVDKKLDKSGGKSMNDTIDGVGVSIWREQGLLLGLAKETSTFIK